MKVTFPHTERLGKSHVRLVPVVGLGLNFPIGFFGKQQNAL
jgi:hypothetical protein